MMEEKIHDNKTRRTFILKILWTVSAIVGVLTAIPILGAVLDPLFRKVPVTWRNVGKVSDFETGKTVLVKYTDSSPLPWAGVTAQTASWLRKISETDFEAFSVNCAHLGCPVRWLPDAELFVCPCHGGVYNKDGSYAAGPPPHGLSRYPVRVRNGSVEIRSSPIPITTILS